MQNRLWEIDTLRGVAIAMMVIFHAAFDLNYLGIIQNSMYAGSWLLLQRATITLFLLLVGVSLYLKYEKTKTFIPFAKRAAFLFAIAILISTVTWLIAPHEFIAFGIIHFIALSTILAYPFLRFYKLNIAIGAALLASSFFFQLPQINTPLLLWFGFTFPSFQSLDYVPLIPWFGIVLIGISLAKLAYEKHQFKLTEPKTQITTALQWMGRNSLAIYLAHQPILFGILKLYTLLH